MIIYLRVRQYKLFQALKREDTVKDQIVPAATRPGWSLSQVYSRTVNIFSDYIPLDPVGGKSKDSYSRSSRVYSPAPEYTQLSRLSPSQTLLTEVLVGPQIGLKEVIKDTQKNLHQVNIIHWRK